MFLCTVRVNNDVLECSIRIEVRFVSLPPCDEPKITDGKMCRTCLVKPVVILVGKEEVLIPQVLLVVAEFVQRHRPRLHL
jgi:hypothetical protein